MDAAAFTNTASLAVCSLIRWVQMFVTKDCLCYDDNSNDNIESVRHWALWAYSELYAVRYTFQSSILVWLWSIHDRTFNTLVIWVDAYAFKGLFLLQRILSLLWRSVSLLWRCVSWDDFFSSEFWVEMHVIVAISIGCSCFLSLPATTFAAYSEGSNWRDVWTICCRGQGSVWAVSC